MSRFQQSILENLKENSNTNLKLQNNAKKNSESNLNHVENENNN